MTFDAFYKKLSNPNGDSIVFANEKIDELSLILTDTYFKSKLKVLQFINCDFNGREIFFEELDKKDLSIFFKNCTFNCNVKFSECNLALLKFIDVKKIGYHFDIFACEIGFFNLINGSKNSANGLNGVIDISGNTFLNDVNFKYLKHLSETFEFSDNTFKTRQGYPVKATFKDAEINNANFSGTEFGDEVTFDGMILSGEASMNNFVACKFEKAYFNATDFGSGAYFNGSVFKNTIIFNRCQNLSKTVSDFSGSTFHGDVYFNYAEFRSLIIKNCSFRGKTSFEKITVGDICLDNTMFEKSCSFEGIKILSVNKCNRNTLRIIKQQLQKSENRIDYNKFRAYELNAYKSELGKDEWKDKFILWLNSISSGHGLEWTRALTFTVTVAFIFYVVYFIAEHFHLEFNFSYMSINLFTKGFFNYLIPSYSSPFEYGLSQWYQYIPFFTGKIFIAYGIFQTIVSFRKYRL